MGYDNVNQIDYCKLYILLLLTFGGKEEQGDRS